MKIINILLLLIIPVILLLIKVKEVHTKMIENKQQKIKLFEQFRISEEQNLLKFPQYRTRTPQSNPCNNITNYIKNNLDRNGVCVFDYDNTLTDDYGRLASCSAAAVSACPSLAVNTYNSGATYDTCCTDPVFVNAGFCPNGKCKVPEKYWANRVGYNQHYLNNKYVGDVFMQGTKTRAMDMMGLNKNNTMLIDDLENNILHAKSNGYKTFHVMGRNGLS